MDGGLGGLFDMIVTTALAPVVTFLEDGTARMFWPYVAAGMAIAWAVHRFSGDQRSFSGMFFTRKAWLSRSALNDYFVLIVNPVLLVYISTWMLGELDTLMRWTAETLRGLGVRGGGFGWSEAQVTLFLTAALYLVNDFGRWFAHYLHHRIPVLWEFHKVHHSAEHLNFATAERFHPVDALLTSAIVIGMTALTNGVFIAFFGDKLSLYTLAGANILWVASNLIGGVLRHSPAWVSYGPRVERWLISPAMHQIHHSCAERHWDKNMGGSLAIWDRMAGTLYIPDGRETFDFGIGEETRDFRSLGVIYLRPFRNALAMCAEGASTLFGRARQ